MANDSPGQRVIAVIDLRKLDLGLLTTRRFHEIQADHAPSDDWGRVDFSRAVIIDEVTKLAEHDEVYTHILTSGVDVSVVCIAVGQLSDGDPAVAISRPYQLQPPWAATLWVSDAAGIGWRMESSQADVVYPHDPADGHLPPDSLTESLAIPQVFDRVLKTVSGMAGAVASPGIRINHSGVDPDRLRTAQQAAIRQLTRSGRAVPQQRPAVEVGSLIGSPDTSSRRDPLRAGSTLDELYQQCQRAADEANKAAERLRGPSGLLPGGRGSQLRTALSQLGDRTGQFTEVIEDLLDFADPQVSFGTPHYEELSRQGIDFPPPSEQETTVAVDVLSDLTLTALDQRQPLPAIAEALRDAADQVVPKGTRPYLERLRRLCPDNALRKLRKPPAVMAGASLSVPTALTALVALLAGLWPHPRGLCGAVAVLGCAVAAVWVASRAGKITGLPLTAGWRFIAAQVGAAVVGAGCGTALSKAAPIAVPAGIPATALAAALTLILVAALACIWWSDLIRGWLRAMGLSAQLRTARLLRSLLGEITSQEWQPAAERRAASDQARIMAGIIEDVTSGLNAHADGLSHTGDRSPADADIDPRTAEQRARSAERESEILAIELIDLADAVVAVLSRLFVPLSTGSSTAPGAATVHRVLERELASYTEHLATAGIYEAPPFGRGSPQRQRSVDTLLERSFGLEDLVWSSERDPNIIQLCAPDHLGLLEVDPAKVEMVRFAPRSGQEFATRTLGRWTGGQSPEAARMEWTATGRISGVLRLVPLRTGAVEEVLPARHSNPGLDLGMGFGTDAGSYFGAMDWTAAPGSDDD
jgi:hypothetical protein